MKENKIQKVKSPLKLIISITDRGVAKDIENYLNDMGCTGGVVFMGKGTAESVVADIFGFGISDKDVLAVLVPTAKYKKIIKQINEITGIETDKYGLLIALDLQSAGSNLLDALHVKIGG